MSTSDGTALSVCSREFSKVGECPLWNFRTQRLLYLDLVDPHIVEFNLLDGTTRRQRLRLRAPLGGLCMRHSGAYLVFNRDGVYAIDEQLTLAERVCLPHSSFAFAPPNDVTVHSGGWVLVATADISESAPTGGLFCLTPDGAWLQLIKDVTVGNGPAFSPDGKTIYLADSPRGIIYAYDFQSDPICVENRRIFATVPPSEGLPDGISVDESGCVWNARWGGHALARYSPVGRELEKIEVPARHVTSCAFGGDDLRTLFVTTADSSVAAQSDIHDNGGLLYKMHVRIPGSNLPAAKI
jgi:xylono-1,5-lactonase